MTRDESGVSIEPYRYSAAAIFAAAVCSSS